MPQLPSQSPLKRGRRETARTVALTILWQVEHNRLFADDVFNRVTQKISLQDQDRSLAFDLVYGVLRWRETLDWYLNSVLDRVVHRLPLVIALALRLGAYQMLHLDRIPVSAAINESVNLVKTVKGRDWTGFVNGVLRSLSREPKRPFPDPVQEPAKALSIRYSCPLWLTERWVAQFGFEGAMRACRHTIDIPKLTLRINPLRCSRDDLEARLQNLGHLVERTPVSPVGLVLTKCGPLATLEPLKEGWCYVEDEAAQLIPLLLDVKPGHRVLDVCAAPGGKTTHIAALMKNQGEIIATDLSRPRLKILDDNCHRLGIPIVKSYLANMQRSPSIPSRTHVSSQGTFDPGFDRILVDAPCSGLGILNRHPEAKWHRDPRQLSKYHDVQSQLLEQASRLLRPGGVLVYSACSVEPEESIQVISRFCRVHPEFHHEAATPWLPPLGRSLVNQTGDLMTLTTPYSLDGFFGCRLRKAEAS